jgi:hypothetical protein
MKAAIGRENRALACDVASRPMFFDWTTSFRVLQRRSAMLDRVRVAAFIYLSWPAIAHAVPLLDQSYLLQENLAGSAIVSVQTVAQTFTVGIGGTLSQVGVQTYQSPGTVGDVNLEILRTSGGVPTGSPLFSGTIPLAKLPTFEFPTFPFPTVPVTTVDVSTAHMNVAPGDQLAISLSRSGFGSPPWVIWNEGWESPYYTGGAPFTTFPAGTWRSISEEIGDLGFQTFVEPAAPPLPASLIFRETNAGVLGLDHVGLHVDDLVYESHPGYGNVTYVDVTGSEQVTTDHFYGVQAQHTRGTFLHDSHLPGAENSPVKETREIVIDANLAKTMRTFIEPLMGQGQYLDFSNWHEKLFLNGDQKGATGEYSCVGLIEWAAEQAGWNAGHGFVPNYLEYFTWLTPDVLLWSLQHPAAIMPIITAASNYITGVLDPVDFMLIDPLGRRLGRTQHLGSINEIPDAFYSLVNGLDQFIIPSLVSGSYELELYGVDAQANVWVSDKSGLLEEYSGFMPVGTSQALKFSIADGRVPEPNSFFLLLLALGWLAYGQATHSKNARRV